MKISIVIPCFNEQEVIEELFKRLSDVLDQCLHEETIRDYELLFVDDGSSDNTYTVLGSLALKDPRVKAISFSRNFGHQIAISAGLDYVNSDAVVIMDADLQDPPEMIPEMLAKWKAGYKIVHMKRKKRLGERIFKRLFAKVFYRLLSKLSSIDIPLDTGDFKLLDKDVVGYLKKIKEHHRFMRGLEVLPGFSQTSLEYDRSARLAGLPKYSFWKSLSLAIDGITSFSSRPLRVVTYVGLLGIISSIGLTAYAVISKIYSPQTTLSGWTSLLISLTFFSGIQLISLGLIGEYVGRIYDEVKQRPLYVIKDTINI